MTNFLDAFKKAVDNAITKNIEYKKSHSELIIKVIQVLEQYE